MKKLEKPNGKSHLESFNKNLTTALSAAVFLLLATSLQAATNVVTNLSDTGPGTLRAALGGATSGDVVTFAVQGNIFLASPLLIEKNIRIAGPGRDKLIIDGQRQTLIFLVASNVTASISDLALSNAYHAIFDVEGRGGAVHNLGNLTMTRCVVTKSTSEFGDGGGISSQGNLTVRQCSVSNNAAIFGGGISHQGSGRLIIDSSAINANRALAPEGSFGGGIAVLGGLGLLTNVTVSGNNAFDGDGGGIFADTYIRLESCTVASNVASAIRFSTPIHGEGGGLALLGPNAVAEMRNTLVWGNSATRTFGTVVQHVDPDIRGFVFSQGWNLIGNTSDATIAGVPTGNLLGFIWNPFLLPLQNNGGPTPTHALGSSSSAIDHASPFDFPRTDQRGVARPLDGDGDDIPRSDIGAFEKETLIPGLAGGGLLVVSLADDSSFGTLRYTIQNAQPGSKISFAVQGTIFLTNGQLVIDKNLQIAGPGADKLIIEPRSFPFPPFAANRAFFISSNVTASIFDLTVQNGNAGTPGLEVVGGGIMNFGNLTLTRCLITNCNAEFGPGGGIGSAGPLALRQCDISGNHSGEGGAGVFCDGRFVAHNCTISQNRSLDPLNSDGAGILLGRGVGLLTNCTVSGNTNSGGSGGGIFTRSYMLLESCTIVSNTTSGINNGPNEIDGRGGGVFSTATFESRNSIFAGNSATTLGVGEQHLGPDCFGTMLSQGWNLIQNPSNCVIAGVLSGNLLNVDPLLSPLANNGGLGPTHALLPGSRAIDAGSPFVFPPTDERGISRPQDGNGDGIFRTDIGAFEKETPVPN